MSRFYVRPEFIKGRKIHIGKKESHHIIDVMRMKVGDSVTVFDGRGKEYEGRISSTANKNVIVDVSDIKTLDKKHRTRISLAQAVPKMGKMDLIIQKATELGVSEIFPVESLRTVVKSKQDARQRKIERWQGIAIESSKQCGRTELPKVRDIICFDDLLNYIPKYDLTIMPCLVEESIMLKSVLKSAKRPENILVII